MNSFFNYFTSSSAITIFVLLLLSIYFIVTFWIFLDRYYILNSRILSEAHSLKALYTNQSRSAARNSLIFTYLTRVSKPNKAILEAAISDALRVSTKGLTWLSIIASTSPFIGLFGTVIGILETFSKLGSQSSASLSVVAPAISEALIATAAGIAVAIFAYSFHLILKRKAYELSSLLTSQSEVILSQA
ncbi:MAG: MotA/TolQ/ExbB proton channel family protein [Sulfurovum sp.]|nr:MotA/TolQ/ExbB proton channel family protein [Sulfurovum sp.]MCB4760001.1 MotA/TolQ/ExbB proton channel family protein [Sulfurovum sp.]MCB4766944.1 MotA/TolQ/ExbB proton channel family protein [Sulfurovum sp.]MCB4779146.1 MotA/TolQ/ExbB proton channel family protein [Sulfurovum sp.]